MELKCRAFRTKGAFELKEPVQAGGILIRLTVSHKGLRGQGCTSDASNRANKEGSWVNCSGFVDVDDDLVVVKD